jgi:hypothetical protein
MGCHQLLLVRLYCLYLRLRCLKARYCCCTSPCQHLLHRHRCGRCLLLLLLLLLQGSRIGC